MGQRGVPRRARMVVGAGGGAAGWRGARRLGVRGVHRQAFAPHRGDRREVGVSVQNRSMIELLNDRRNNRTAAAARAAVKMLAVASGVVGVLLAAPPPVRAQVERGELQLLVSDRTGLPVRAAGTLTSEAPQLARAFSTDDRGRFTLQNLPFGVYRLILEHAG